MAVRAKTVDGWVAFGFADKQFVMDGARVIMATPGNTKTYRLSGYKVPAAGWPEEAIPCLVDNSIEVTRTSAETILQFEMKNVRSGESFHALVAFSRTSGSHLDKHSAGTSQVALRPALQVRSTRD